MEGVKKMTTFESLEEAQEFFIIKMPTGELWEELYSLSEISHLQ